LGFFTPHAQGIVSDTLDALFEDMNRRAKEKLKWVITWDLPAYLRANYSEPPASYSTPPASVIYSSPSRLTARSKSAQ
jgi:hypothetical protein